MKTIRAEVAKTQFDELLKDAENGEIVILTRQGQPVAQLGPVNDEISDAVAAMEEIHRFRRTFRPMLDGITIRELIEEGRE